VQVVGGFSLFTDGFVDVFATSTENGRRLSALSERIRGLKNDLTRMQEAIDRRYDDELAAQGIESWTIENDRLKGIIERFTIFTHKQQAGDLVGLNVEEGVEAGDITMF
ncbi:MAG: hypothetical protein PF508_00565, partial [Spirochaeta sp.]|nr:hypothetical protein [Spirochaeta sp.]